MTVEIPSRMPKLFGQQKPGECAYGRVTARKIHHGAGVVVDGAGHVYVADTGNNRILGFRNIDSPVADLVFGQPDAFSGAPNGDCRTGAFGRPTRRSLCLIDVPGNPNIGEQWMRLHIDVDHEGNLYVPDFHNNRVLIWFAPFRTDAGRPAGSGDVLPDVVIGQNDFTSNGINRGNGATARDNRGLYLSLGPVDHVSSRGVSVDREQNVWVADTFNHRVLRFPKGARAADLVLGAPTFTDPTEPPVPPATGGPLDRMFTPVIARINPLNGSLWVIDEWPFGFKSRILVFQPPFTDGMPATRVVIPKQVEAGDFAGGYEFFMAGSLVFNPFRTDDPIHPERPVGLTYRDGVVWVSERTRVMLLDGRGDILVALVAPDVITHGGRPDVFIRSGLGETTPFNLFWPGGMIGFDPSNIYAADEQYHRVARYALPYRTGRNAAGEVTVPASNGGLCAGTIPNEIGPANFSGWNLGAFAHGGQLVVRDYRRYMIWNNYMRVLVDGPPASLIRLQNANPPIEGRAMHTIDDRERLWTVNADKLMVLQLPFTETTAALRQQIPLFWADEPGSTVPIPYVMHQPIAFERATNSLWMFDRAFYRLLRVRIPDAVAGRFVVDAVLGQRNKTASQQNAGNVTPTAFSFGEVSDIRFDSQGNMFVVDNGYECRFPSQNGRVLVFTAKQLAGITPDVPFPLLEARHVLVSQDFTGTGACNLHAAVDRPYSPVSIAFNSRDEMVLGNDGYYTDRKLRSIRQLYLYRTPLEKPAPDAIIELPMGSPGELCFDEGDNLIVQDHTWSKVWIINVEDPQFLKPI